MFFLCVSVYTADTHRQSVAAAVVVKPYLQFHFSNDN